jgi:glycine cleavage system aminomethyltransferase T
MDGDAPAEGTIIRHQGEFAGHVTSSTWSPVLGQAVILGWLDFINGELPQEVTIAGRPARRVATPFYDKEGHRARA